MGTHNGIIHVLDYAGARVKSYRPHSASVIDMCFDETADFIASASIDGKLNGLQQLDSSHECLCRADYYSFTIDNRILCVQYEASYADGFFRAELCEAELARVCLWRYGRKPCTQRKRMAGT